MDLKKISSLCPFYLHVSLSQFVVILLILGSALGNEQNDHVISRQQLQSLEEQMSRLTKPCGEDNCDIAQQYCDTVMNTCASCLQQCENIASSFCIQHCTGRLPNLVFIYALKAHFILPRLR